MAPTTAFSGRNISEDSLAISTAILAAPYATCQAVSLPLIVAPSLDVPQASWNGEPMERAIAVEETASALEFL